MRKLARFWQATEIVVGHEAVAAHWQHLMGDEWPTARRWFRPTTELSTHYPKLEPEPASPLDYRVVCHDEDADGFVGVCPEGTGDRLLRKRNLVLYELDRRKLTGLLAAALDLIPDYAVVPDCPVAYRVGSHRPAAGEQVDVCLSAPPEPADFVDVVPHLIA